MAPKNKKAKSIQERRQARYLQEQIKKAQAEVLEQEEEAEDEILDEEDVEEEISDPAAEALKKQLAEIEEIEKDYGGVMGMPMPGPTSFDELDAAKVAQEQAQEVQEVSWDAQRLVYNIINHPEMDVKEKSDAFQKVGADFGARVSDVLTAPDTEQKDLDLLSLESVIAHDKRKTNIIEQWIDKAVLSTASRKKLDSSQFALPSKRKYPIHDKAHVRNALARAAQQIAEGGAGAADAKAAMPAIRAAAKRMGIEMSMKKDRNAIVVEKDATGHWRWVGWVSNNFEDTDHDIISEIAHKEYVEYLDKNPEMAPGFMTWHTPETMRKSLPDFWGYENGFLIMSGQLTEKEAECLIKAAKLTDLGMSHGTLVISRDENNPHVITKYRMFEASDLPLENAANPFTALETLSKEADMDYKVYLSQFMPIEKAEKLANERTAAMKKELTEAGVKSAETTVVPETKTEATPAAPASLPTNETVIKEVMERLDVPGLNEAMTMLLEKAEKVDLLEMAIKELTASRDDKLAEMIAPPAATLAWSIKDKRPSESPENIVKDGEKVGEAPNPGDMWLSKATGTAPIPVQQ